MLYIVLLNFLHFQPCHLDQCVVCLCFPVGRTTCVYLLDFKMGFDVVFLRLV